VSSGNVVRRAAFQLVASLFDYVQKQSPPVHAGGLSAAKLEGRDLAPAVPELSPLCPHVGTAL
jgi:hypothetical protein